MSISGNILLTRALSSRAMVAALAVCLPYCAAQAQADAEMFEREVRAVLETNCYKCHGDESVKSGLAVVSRNDLIAGGERGPAINLEDPGASLLLEMISYKDAQHEMPPTGKLDPDSIDILKRWVEAGAPWPETAEFELRAEVVNEFEERYEVEKDHWSYQPVVRPVVPAVADSEWQANPIDAFIRQGQTARNLEPAAEASRETLIRRAYYDLTGLPPTPSEVRAFVNDDDPDAWEQLLDHLLASPHYGEKWGRHWLDVVRYADSNGYERDTDKPYIWRYRDYVIGAFNQDKPYDQFIREQLAGDELDEVTAETISATGFYRLGLWDDEPADPAQGRYDNLDSMADTTAQAFLGMTMGCARCHDHKIDPIRQKDYYQFLSFFENITEPRRDNQMIERSILNPFEQAVYDQRVRDKEARIDRLHASKVAFESNVRKRLAEKVPEAAAVSDLVDLTYKFYRDTWNALPDFDMLRPETQGDVTGNYISTAPASRDDAIGLVFEGRLRVPETGGYTFFVESKDGVRLRVNGGTIVEGVKAEEHKLEGEVQLEAGFVPFRLEFFNKRQRPKLSVTWSGPGFEKRALSSESLPEDVRDFKKLIAKHGDAVLTDAERAEYDSLLKTLDETKGETIPGEWAAGVAEYKTPPPDTHIHLRGNPHVHGDKVTPGFPSVLNPPEPAIREYVPNAPTCGRRSAMAEWIASADNPLTARVMVNRIWQHHFGRGIVRSSNDFGIQGTPPTHPELLDWLASEFVAGGWRIKPMHKLIMMSRTYRMASTAHDDGLARDPQNDAFWRFDMRRLTAEEIRDSILYLSGRLNPKMGGPGVYPKLPEEVLATSSMANAMWHESPIREQARRSIYIHVKRSILTPLLTDYDLADTDSTCPVRFATTQPTQALNMLNSEFVNTQAVAFANRLRKEAGPGREEQVRMALNLATSREPEDAEIARAIAFMDELEAGGTPRERALDRFALLVLNLNEVIFLD